MPKAIILARKGSKRLPHKNRRYVGDKMLTEHAIWQAGEVFGVENVVLGTDDEVLDVVGKNLHVDRVMRGEHTGDDDSSIDALKHVSSKYSWINDVVLIQPTSPLREPSAIQLWYSSWEACKENYPAAYSAGISGGPCGCFYVFDYDYLHEGAEDWEQEGLDIEFPHNCIDIDTIEDLNKARSYYRHWVDQEQ